MKQNLTGSLHPQQNLYMNVHNSFIRNGQKLETAQMSINSLLNKCLKSGKKNCYIYTMEYLSAIKGNMNIDAHDNLDESPENSVE